MIRGSIQIDKHANYVDDAAAQINAVAESDLALDQECPRFDAAGYRYTGWSCCKNGSGGKLIQQARRRKLHPKIDGVVNVLYEHALPTIG